jgi:uncharacterized delta-60 repeat protein
MHSFDSLVSISDTQAAQGVAAPGVRRRQNKPIGNSQVTRHQLGIACLIFTALLACQAVGAPGELDSSFGAFGKVSTPFGSGNDAAKRVAIQPDGKIVVAGTCSNGTNADFCVARYNADGVLDTTFSGDGKVITAVGSGDDDVRAMAIQPDGRILLAGTCDNGAPSNFCLVRYSATGALDIGFNGNGKLLSAAGSVSSSLRGLALQPDGKIVVGGTCDNGSGNTFCLARYTTDGALDTTFSGDGKVTTTIGAGVSYIDTVLLQSDGKIVVTGLCYSSAAGGYSQFCLARYNVNGALDTTFNTDGRAQAQIGNYNASAYGGAVLQPDGKIVMAGFCDPLSGQFGATFCLARFEANGALDTSFSTDGQVFTTMGNDNSYIRSVVLQTDGKIIATGPCQGLGTIDFCVARYHGTGALDTSFNTDGRVISAIGSGDDNGDALTVQPDGKIVVVGNCSNGSNDDFCIARYEGGPFGARACSLDIDGDGKVLATTDMLIATRVALGVTGNAVLGGVTFSATATRDEWGTNTVRDIRKFLTTQCGMVLP